MDIFLHNLTWMSYNTFLATISVLCAFAVVKTKFVGLKVLLLIVWLLFIPNSIYLITDLTHLPAQFLKDTTFVRYLILAQYSLLTMAGIVTYFFSFYFLEKEFFRLKIIQTQNQLILFTVFINFLISLGVMMGRIQRTNSWDVLFHPQKVYFDILKVISTLELMIFVVVFAILCNALYFTFKNVLQEKYYLKS